MASPAQQPQLSSFAGVTGTLTPLLRPSLQTHGEQAKHLTEYVQLLAVLQCIKAIRREVSGGWQR